MSVAVLDAPTKPDSVQSESVSVAVPASPVVPTVPKVSLEAYFELERNSEIRHEYVDGELIPMPGTTLTHNDIAMNISVALRIAFRKRKCYVQMEAIRLRVSPTKYRYPDVMAVCGERVTDEGTPPSLLNPSLVVEVLSPSTTDTDLGKKSVEYRTLASVTDYLIVSSDEQFVLHYFRKDARTWNVTDYKSKEDAIQIAALEVTLTLDEIYEGIELTDSVVS